MGQTFVIELGCVVYQVLLPILSLFGLHMHIMYIHVLPLWRYECHILCTSHCMVHVGGAQLPAPPSTTGNPPPAQHPPQSSTSMVHYPPPPLTSIAPGGTHQLLSQASTTASTRMGLSQPHNVRQLGIAGSTQAGPPPTHSSNTQAGPPPTHPSSTQASPNPVGTGPPSTGQILGRPPSGQLTGMYFMTGCVHCCFVHVPYS